MLRLSALALLAASVTMAAPVPKDKEKGKLYFPTTVGAKWVMQQGEPSRDGGETIYEVTKIELKDGKHRVTAEVSFGSRVEHASVYEVSDAGVFHVSVAGSEVDPPQLLVKVGGKAGDTWKSDGKYRSRQGDEEFRVRFTQVGEEEVEVPAGKFKAIRVDQEIGMAGEKVVRVSYWYAPEIGHIKTATEADGRMSTVVLKSFTPGKEVKADDKKKDETKKDK